MKIKKILALLLALALVLSLAACSGGSSNGGSSSTGGSGETYEFPLKEKVTLTAWRQAPTNDPKFDIVTFNDIEYVQKFEEKTNVHIEWDVPASGTEQEKYNLMISSGEYPDMIWNPSYYAGGMDKAIADGVVRPLDDIIEEYAPDYLKLISKDDTTHKDSMTDEGHYAVVWMINYPDQGPWYGLTVRKDWLDQLGMDLPVTYDDWHDMLKAFKDQMGATNPLWVNSRASDAFNIFPAGYGVAALGASSTAPFYNVDGTVHYGPLEQGFKDYITMMNQWYAEGLVDPDYYTRTDYFVPDDLAGTGKAGAFCDIYTLIDLKPILSVDTSIETVAVAQPVVNAGDTVHLRQYNWSRGTDGCSITTACKNPELALAWLNLGSIEEYSMLCYWGEEGDTYEMVDGEPIFTDKIMNNPDFSASEALTKYFWRHAGMYRWSRELQTAGPKAIDAIENVWVSNSDGAYFMPNITLTSEEGTEFARLMGDIDTYVSEMTTKFILGTESLDNWDNFIATLESMDIQKAIELEQAALDRFNDR